MANDQTTVDSSSSKQMCLQSKASMTDLFKKGKLDELRRKVQDELSEGTFNAQQLLEFAELDESAASFARELVSTLKIDENDLVERVAREIIRDTEEYVNTHLAKFGKFTLNAPQLESANFFNLIILLKDVSVLGRKLFELAPRFESLRSRTASPSSSLDKKFFQSSNQTKNNPPSHLRDDATSDEFLAALIESSSADDFLVLSSSLESISTRDMMLSSLLLIKSHECFTLSHDIQDVAMIMRRTKFIILNILAPKDQMELVAKILTAIGRYNEMNYVFDLFRDRNQFEILLSKGVEKKPELRIALFNYVKKNPEFHTLVTLNFSMFGEIAESLESSATRRLSEMTEPKRISNRDRFSKRPSESGAMSQLGRSDSPNLYSSEGQKFPLHRQLSSPNLAALSIKSHGPSTQLLSPSTASITSSGFFSHSIRTTSDIRTESPQDIVSNYSVEKLSLSLMELVDAADCFAKAGRYKRSNKCQNKAKLVALQLAKLPCEINLLNLKQNQLIDLIVSFESFSDALVVAEAYDFHLAWHQALFRNVILLGQLDYLTDFCQRLELTEPLVKEVVSLYKQHVAGSNQTTLDQDDNRQLSSSMKVVLSHLTKVVTKCELFTQLNFNEAKNELISDPSVRAYLEDLKLI